MVKRLLALTCVLGVIACTKSADSPVTPVSTTINVVFPGGTIAARIAALTAARDTGLMNVTTLGANAGMLFVFAVDEVPVNCAFYMKNTPLPLSIAFIDANMKVINVDEMAAEDAITIHKPTSACRYALEANQGWMSAHGVSAGTTVSFALPAGTIIDP
jgi:uncharacterized membrane protein (UPF0127 family)